jgi:hypothetical protein
MNNFTTLVLYRIVTLAADIEGTMQNPEISDELKYKWDVMNQASKIKNLALYGTEDTDWQSPAEGDVIITLDANEMYRNIKKVTGKDSEAEEILKLFRDFLTLHSKQVTNS